MKTKLFTSFAFWVLILSHLTLPVCSQVGSSPENQEDFLLTIRNVIQTADNIFEFDIWLQDIDSLQPMEMATIQFGILYNPDLLACGVISPQMVSLVPGSSQLPTNMQPANPNTSIYGLIRVAGRTPPGHGNGFIVSTTAPGTRICRLRFTNSSPFPVNTQPCLEFTSSTATNPLYATRVAVYINSINTQLPVVPGENAQVLENPALNPDLNNPTPIAYTVTGGGGYCGALSGLPVGLGLSQISVNYELFRDGVSTNLIQPGTGCPISFGAQSAGTYTITGTNESGTNLMSGNAVVFELPVPVVTLSADQDTVCQGSMVTFTVMASNAVNPAYQWYKNFVPVGSNSPGYSYTPDYHFQDLIYVKVTTGTGCFAFSDTLSSSAFDTTAPSVEIDSESTLSLVAGTELSFDVLTNNAGENPYFQWYVNGLPVDDGNESQYTYFPENGDTFFVQMTVDDDHPCITTTFDQSDEVLVYTCTGPPIAYDVWGGGEYCLYGESFFFGLTDTEPGVEYIVYFHFYDDDYDYIEDEFSGTGEPYTISGSVGFVYWIQGINACDTTRMNGNVRATYFDDRAYVSASENNICSGTPVTFSAHTYSSDTISYLFDWIVNDITVYNGRQFTYSPENGDLVAAHMTYPCSNPYGTISLLMMVRNCQGATTTWTGNSGSDWQNPENWSNGVPQSDFSVNIPGGCLHYPILTTPAACESIIIEDGGSFIGSEFLDEKTALVKCNISSPEFHFLSSAVMGFQQNYYEYYPTFGSVFPDNQQTVWVRRYHEYSGNWINQIFDNFLINTIGYSVQSTQPQTAQFIGLLSDITECYIYQNNPGSDPDRVGWNLLGNPFPCSLDWDLIPNSTAEQAVYVWNGTQYISWNGTVGALTNGIIPPMNGFFVKALNLNWSLFIIPLSARVHSNVPFYKESITNLIELEVTGNNYSDVTYIHLNSEATKGFDAHSDARKLRGIEDAPQLFSYAGGKELSINEQPFEPAVVIELGFTCGKSGNFILNGKGLESFNNNVRILLEDVKEGIFQNLSDNVQYSFSYIAGESEHRFKLHFTENSSNPEPSEVSIYSVGKKVIVNNYTGLSGDIQVYDFTGRIILNSSIDSGNQSSFTLSAAAGPYVVKVITAKGVHSRKVVIM